MSELRTVHTADLTGDERAEIRALLETAFGEDFTDADWEHALGGMHMLIRDHAGQAGLVAHGSLVQRRLLHCGRALRTGYVEAVAVRPDRQRQGYGGRVMDEIERLIVAAYDVGALSTGDGVEDFYLVRGWRPWLGDTKVMAPGGIVATPDDDGSTYVFAVDGGAELNGAEDLVCDWREGDVW